MRQARLNVSAILLLTVAACTRSGPVATKPQTGTPSSNIQAYIAKTWTTLTRSSLSCGAMIDPKLPAGKSILYLPADQRITGEMTAAARECDVHIEHLPPTATVGNIDPAAIAPGLLYVPNPYVVPGGRFNEMYGWDSYFILEGLLESGRVDLARGMAENFFYELDHYGAILNANRTYYLTRSQPPFLTSMILDVEKHLPSEESQRWLEHGYAAAKKDWAFWNRLELRAGDTGLNRYFDFGHGPVPEMHDDPAYYQNVIAHLIAMGPAGNTFLQESSASGHVPAAVDPLTKKTFTLTEDFYLGDRALRASGFDITNRFGPYGGLTHHFAPVCLNSLLYKEELDLARMADRLNKRDEAALWQSRAAARKAAIHRYLWDEQAGMYFDYDFVEKRRSTYAFAATFYPLWVRASSEDQAVRLAKHLTEFLQAGGVATSTTKTGLQWDSPFSWAPLQLLTAEGLRNYGYEREANELSHRWLSMIEENFVRDGTLYEKYNCIDRSSEVVVQTGYAQNAVGFGWTNAVYLKLWREFHEGGSHAQQEQSRRRGR